MPAAPLPLEEAGRLEALHELEILDTPAEAAFDRITHLAARLLDAPVAVISLVDKDREWFKSCHGTDMRQADRRIAFCAYTILDNKPLNVPDARLDARFANNPQVTEQGVRAYLGAPLVARSGRNIGALCIKDTRPRQFTHAQESTLSDLAAIVVDEIEYRLAAARVFGAERKLRQAVEHARESQEILQRFYSCSHLPMGVVEVRDRDVVHLSANEATARYFRTTVEHVVQRSISELGAPRDRIDVWLAQYARCQAHGAPVRFEYERNDTVGARRHSATVSHIGVSPAGRPRFSYIIEDITERRRAEEAERDRGHLAEAVASMEQVLGVIGHELRTPLAGVRAMAEFLLQSNLASLGDDRRFIASISAEACRLAAMVNNMLEAARLNSGHAQWQWADVTLHSLCQEAVHSLAPLNASGVELVCEVQPPDLRMRGDTDAIRRLLINLLTNALKHTSAGHITVSARAQHQSDTRAIELTVTDTGEGIPREIMAKLGNAFALNSGVVGAAHVRGAGLGLAICKGIAAAHGGSLSFLARPGRGTVVRVRMLADLHAPMNLRAEAASRPEAA